MVRAILWAGILAAAALVGAGARAETVQTVISISR